MVAVNETPAALGSDEWRTPLDFFHEQWKRFRFNVDAAATAENALVRPPCELEVCRNMFGYYDRTDVPVDEPAPCHGDWCKVCDLHTGRYYTRETNGLDPEHYLPGDRVWCNPPYSKGQCGPWVALADKLAREKGILWCLLVPPSIDTGWFHDYIWDAETHQLRERVELQMFRGRLKFGDPLGLKRMAPTSGNLLVVFHPAVSA